MQQRVLIFGATGGTGRSILAQAHEAMYEVKVMVRDPNQVDLRAHNLSVVQGDVLNAMDVQQAVQEVDVVFVCLGAALDNRQMVRANGTANIIRAMQAQEVKRLICQTTMGMGDTFEMLSPQMRNFVVPNIMKHAFEDHAQQEAYVQQSDLDWTLVRPSNLTNDAISGIYRVGTEPDTNIKGRIARADVAQFMLDCWQQERYKRQAVWISG